MLAVGVLHTGAKYECELVALLSDRWLLSSMLAVGVMHTGAKSGCKLVTLLSDRWLLLVTKVLLGQYLGQTLESLNS